MRDHARPPEPKVLSPSVAAHVSCPGLAAAPRAGRLPFVLATLLVVTPQTMPAQGVPTKQGVPEAAGVAPADETMPKLEVSLSTDSVTVGMPITITLTLLVPTYLLQPPTWPDLQLADAITRTAPGTSRPTSRRIGQENWAGVSHSVLVTPQRAADYVFPDATVGVTWADPATNEPVQMDLPLPAITFTAVLPEGAAGLDPFVTASALSLTTTVDGPGEAPNLGAAVTLTLTIEAQDTEAMLLPPLLERLETPQGLRAYPRQPELTDTPGERGGPGTARRTEAVTYVVETPGDYRLSGLQLDWWNSAESRVETAATDPVSFSVPAPPGWTPPLSLEEQESRRRMLLAGAAGFSAVALALWFLRGRILATLTRWRARRAASEPVLYRRVLRLARTGDLAALRPALDQWLALFDVTHPPPEFERSLRQAERQLWGPSAPAVAGNSRAVVAALHTVRAELRAGVRSTWRSPLPPLNPWQQELP